MTDQLPDLTGNNERQIEARPVVVVGFDGQEAVIATRSVRDKGIVEGRTFSAGTGVRTVPAGEYLKFRLVNPSGSGKHLYITDRIFSNDRSYTDANMVSELVVNPSAISGATLVTPNNLMPGSGASVASFEHSAGAAQLGTPVLSRLLPLNGVFDSIAIPRIVLPGEAFGYQIEGRGTVASENAARASMTLVWSESDYDV